MSKKGLGKFLAGAAIGAGLGVLLAPEKGEKTRKKVKTSYDNFVEEIKKLDYNEVRDNLIKKVEEIEKEVKSLDKEKVASISKEKASMIIEKANTLYKDAVKANKPMLEKYAREFKEKTKGVVEGFINSPEEKKTNTQT